MTVRLYRAKGEFEAYSLAPDAAAAVRLATRGRQCCERVYEATAEVVTAAVGPLATRCPDRVDVAYESELGGRGKWTVAQWAAAAPADAAAEADRLRTEAVACDLRAAKLRAEAEELAKQADGGARARRAGIEERDACCAQRADRVAQGLSRGAREGSRPPDLRRHHGSVPGTDGGRGMSARGGSPRRKGRGEFFAVDRRCWGAVCGLAGDVPPEYAAAAYLVLACFSDGSNTTSTASANAVEKYAGLTPGRATKAIKALVDAGAVEALPVEGSAKAGPRVPRHRLRPWSEFREVLARRYGDQLRRLRGSPRITSPLRCAATELVQAGLALPTGLDGEGNPVALEVEPEGDGSPDWVWLPNALVRGAGRGTPPVERARRTARVDNLRVLVELYAEHDLSEDGGVSRETWRETYKRAGPIYAIGGHPIYGFVRDERYAQHSARLFRALGGPRYWNAIQWVRTAGLASHVLLVTESGSLDAQPRAQGTETAQEPEPSEANRVAAFLGSLRDAGLPEPEGAP